jgi:endonuclease YncB( thermonuclease family)
MKPAGITKNCPECGSAIEVRSVVCECGHWFFRELEVQQSTELEQARWKNRTGKLRNLSVVGGFAALLLFVPAYWGGYIGGESSARIDEPAQAVDTPAAGQPVRRENDAVLPRNVQFTVATVLTGDTLVILDQASRERRVRIFAISSPKLDQRGGIEAKENLAKLVLGKGVFILTRADADATIVADVLKDGISIGLEQLRAGMAEVLDDEAALLNEVQQRAYADAESAAMNGRAGIWNGGSDTRLASLPPASAMARSESGPRPAYLSTPTQPIEQPADQGADPGPPAVETVQEPVAAPVTPPPPPAEVVKTETAVQPTPVKIPGPPVPRASSIAAPAKRAYTRGPRGGCFYVSASGSKTYVDRSLCN